ncbi:MAG: class I SAM-dependent methyltransferase [Bauldia sp.]
MHPTIFEAFDEVCRSESVGGAILEVGAVPGDDTLLRLPALRNASSRIGINLEPAFRDGAIEIVSGTGNDMRQFADGSFDAVLSNSVLEHDRAFWLTLAEIRRVTRPGGLMAIGVPGFGAMKTEPLWRLARLAGRVPFLGRRPRAVAAWLGVAAPTLGLHRFPEDYYRFSEAAVRDVFLEGLAGVKVRQILMPPRFIGWGRMPLARG